MNNPFDYVPDEACDGAIRELTSRLELLRKSPNSADDNFISELDDGKMLGVLIATDQNGTDHKLYAFSGQLGCGGFHYDGFVAPVFDYLDPEGYFKQKEADISCQNRETDQFEEETLCVLQREYEFSKAKADAEISEYKEKCRQSKLKRDAKRSSGILDENELAAMIRESQFEKAELHRLKKKTAEKLEPLAKRLKAAQSQLDAMKEKRRKDSEVLQNWLFSNFKVLNAKGESKSLKEIFAETPMRIPPSGAGECCAPKLLQSAYLRGWQPKSIAEYWYGRPKRGEVRVHGMYYPACRGKCLPVLSWMLQGLEVEPPLDSERLQCNVYDPEIIFENQWFCVVNKPSGMLSVPGKGAYISLQQWLIERYGAARNVKMAHRLDQDTSGVIIATFGDTSYKTMQALFARRETQKTYIADLDGDYRSQGVSPAGRIELPLSPDWLDRPRQCVDIENGKPALTEYEFISVYNGFSRVMFRPLTGRTHQLRVHAASEMGLNMPIVGDRLYGRKACSADNSLHLHAFRIEFTFPLDGKHYVFETPVPF